MNGNFDYATAFSRNIGWITRAEQERLRGRRIAIAGMGGVGGSHLITLTRLGIGRFHIADFDCFELQNMNRQAGASLSRLGRPKVDVLAEMILDINPEVEIRRFPEGVNENNLNEFFDGVDLYVDSLDFFTVKARRMVFAACAEKAIPAITAAPLGMGVALLSFLPGKMTFEEYFQLEGQPEEEQLIRFLLGLSPAMPQNAYLVDPSAIDLVNHRGPSTIMGCELCAGMAATQALKILLGRGKVLAAPHGLHFDAYLNRLIHTWRPWGNRNPIQKLGLAIARKKFGAAYRRQLSQANPSQPRTTIEQILDLARWAPSGDNTQPWRFEIKDDHHLVVHGFDTRDHCVYDRRGHASQISIGMLLETIAIAASQHQLRCEFVRRLDTPETHPTFDVTFHEDSNGKVDPLVAFIRERTTQRRLMQPRVLSKEQHAELEASVGPSHRVVWLEGWSNKLRMAALLFQNGKIRLTIPEAYQVHKAVIEWNARFSNDRIPDQALGVDPLTARIMQWVMQNWERVKFFNTYLGGTLLPRIQLDFLPALFCGAHFVIVADKKPHSIDDFVAAGRVMQRFWLTAARLRLQLQPEMTPLIFSSYVQDGIKFTETEQAWKDAQQLSERLEKLIGSKESQGAVYLGRIGFGQPPQARSTRLPLGQLIVEKSQA